MSFKAEILKAGIKALHGVQKGEFTTAAGMSADRKLEMGVLEKSALLRGLMVHELVTLAGVYRPDLIVPMPTGGNSVGADVARRMDIDVSLLEWADKEPGQKRLVTPDADTYHRIQRAERIVLVDDVFTTGSSLRAVESIPVLADKVQGAVIMWNRAEEGVMQRMPFEVRAVIEEYIPIKREVA